MKLFLCNNKQAIYNAYTPEQIGDAAVITGQELLESPRPDIRFVFSTWGMPALSEEEIKTVLPNVEAVFYAAGSVQHFARPFLNKGINVISAWAANAIPVAEYTVAQIILANKGFFQLHNRYKHDGHKSAFDYSNTFPGNYDTKVGLIGAGMIGRIVIDLLKPFNLNLCVYDKFACEADISALGAKKYSLEDIFLECQTISNHLANNAQTKGMLDYSLFSLMKDNATFINTGRGAQIVVEDLFKAMKEKPTRTAVLDVTDPTEPLPTDAEYFSYPNIIITPHRAGSINNEIYRMGAYVFEEFDRLQKGEALRYAVDLKMLETMA